MTQWFSADFHFQHNNIIKFCNRPFKDVDEMTEVLIKNHNNKVQPSDDFFFLGDFAFGSDQQKIKNIFDRLNGNKNLIVGNHDGNLTKNLGWKSINTRLEIKINNIWVVLDHFPLLSWNHSYHGSLHLHGHSHGSIPGTTQRCDVGVDNFEMSPCNLDEIQLRLAGCKPHKEQYTD